MKQTECPKCGREAAQGSPGAPGALCPACGQPAANGAPARRDPPPPPELAGVVFERPTPEMIEEARRTFDAEEYLAGVREIEAGGGVQIDDLIAELERRVNGTG